MGLPIIATADGHYFCEHSHLITKESFILDVPRTVFEEIDFSRLTVCGYSENKFIHPGDERPVGDYLPHFRTMLVQGNDYTVTYHSQDKSFFVGVAFQIFNYQHLYVGIILPTKCRSLLC